MSLYQKVRLLFRASAEAPMRELVAKNDIIIFEQEISDAEKAIRMAKQHLAQIKTEAKLIDSAIAHLKADISSREEQALLALEKDEALANDLAALIAQDEQLLKDHEAQLASLRNIEARVSSDIRSAVRAIQSHRQKLGFLKANQHSLHANANLKSTSTGMHGSMRTLHDSLKSINDGQFRARLLDEAEQDVENEVNNAGIESRLKVAGISAQESRTASVLLRLKNQKQGKTEIREQQ